MARRQLKSGNKAALDILNNGLEELFEDAPTRGFGILFNALIYMGFSADRALEMLNYDSTLINEGHDPNLTRLREAIRAIRKVTKTRQQAKLIINLLKDIRTMESRMMQKHAFNCPIPVDMLIASIANCVLYNMREQIGIDIRQFCDFYTGAQMEADTITQRYLCCA